MASSCSSPSSRYYKLYLRKKSEPIFHVDDPQGRILFVFCLARSDARAKIQRWTYAGLVYARWDDDIASPLVLETSDVALYGIVDARQVEDENSELRRIIDLSPEDFDRHDAEWQHWRDSEVQRERAKGKGKGRHDEASDEALRLKVMLDHRSNWQGEFFMALAQDKIALLVNKKLLF